MSNANQSCPVVDRRQDDSITEMALIALRARVEAGASRRIESPADIKRRRLMSLFDRMIREPNAPHGGALPAQLDVPSIGELLARAKAAAQAGSQTNDA